MAQGPGEDLAGCAGCAGFGCALIGITILAGMLLFAYGVVVLVMRSAFGIELPNPVDWLPPEWAEYIPMS